MLRPLVGGAGGSARVAVLNNTNNNNYNRSYIGEQFYTCLPRVISGLFLA